MHPIEAARAAGETVYFTGSPCRAGHVAPRVVASRMCVVCARGKTRKWVAENSVHVAGYKKRYTDENRAAIYDVQRSWRAQNPERVKRNKAADHARHKAERLVTMKRWRIANADKVREGQARKVAADPAKYRAYARNYKIRKRGAPGSHTGEDVIAILKAQRGKCAYCRIVLKSKYHVDHILALSKGGSNDRSNIQILCQPCNQSKSSKDPIVFAQSLGMLL